MNAVRNLAHLFATHPLTRREPLRAWARFVSWQLKSRIRGDLLFPWIRGQRLVIQNGMTGATGNVYVGLHEFVDMMLLLHFLREGDLFLDIGANVGSYTVLASGVCRAKTWAFEPDPTTLRHLRRNIAVNALEGLVVAFECALGAETNEVPFTVGLDTQNRIANPEDKNVRIVRQEPVDALIGNSRPIMIKLDVEGAEGNILQGAAGLLGNRCLKVIELETVTPESAYILDKNEFERAYYDPFSRRLGREPVGSGSSNVLFVRDWPFVACRLATAEKIEVLDSTI
jgi:FkbM family methyltransferase